MRRTPTLSALARKLALIAVALGISACGPRYDYLDLELLSTPPSPELVSVSSDGLFLPVGQAVLIAATPISETRRDYTEDTKIELVSRDPTFLQIFAHGPVGEFVVIGQRAGEGELRVYVDGERQGMLAVVVVATSP